MRHANHLYPFAFYPAYALAVSLPVILGQLAFMVIPATVSAGGHDIALRQQLSHQGIQPLASLPPSNPAELELGRSLFFDRELSGNRDTSCASCHHPSMSSGDSRSLPAGTGGTGLGPHRTQAEGRETVPRNSPDIFHRGDPQWDSMFWDSRVNTNGDQLMTPAKQDLPSNIKDVLTAQAMFPVTSRAEMRGNIGDRDINGQINELANIADDDFQGIWQAIINRLVAIPAYQDAFAKAYPDVPQEQLGFQHAAQAIATFEKKTFSQRDSAWDRYVAGDNNALSESAKRGASHFFGGNCASCHSGSLMTDREHHNTGVPQLGPGKDPTTELDPGRSLQSGTQADEFAFRTPPLRNVMLTGPWMHNGAFTRIEDVIRHKFDPVESINNYDPNLLEESLRSSVRFDPETIEAITEKISPLMLDNEALGDEQLNDLMAFLFSLTTPSADLMLETTPASVLSGLEVDRLPASEFAVIYDPENGGLQIIGNEELSLDALFFRISEESNGSTTSIEFEEGMAPWADHPEIILSDESDAQSFLEYRHDPSFLVKSGDIIESLLPAGLSSDAVKQLSAAYRVHGSPILWQAEVVMVPEPTSTILFLTGLCGWLFRRRRAP